MRFPHPLPICLLLASAGIAGCCFSPPSMEDVGGVHLVYEIDEAASVDAFGQLDFESAVNVLNWRLDSFGFVAHSVEPVGSDQIDIAIVGIQPHELERVKKHITASGELELLIVANPRDDGPLIERARQTDSDIVVDEDGREIGKWVPVHAASEDASPMQRGDVLRGRSETDEWIPLALEFGETDQQILVATDTPSPAGDDAPLTPWPGEEVQMLLRLNPNKKHRVTGDHISSAAVGLDQIGKPAVNFYMSREGSVLLESLTSRNVPDRATNFYRRMAIVFNGEVLSAPRLNSVIADRGEINGDFTLQEVEAIVAMLNSGRLPIILKPQPVEETWVEPAE